MYFTFQVGISEIEDRLAEQNEGKLQQFLQELRDQYGGQMRANRDGIELLYEYKIKNLASQAQCYSEAAAMTVEELNRTQSKNEILNTKINELEATINTLNACNRYLVYNILAIV